MFPRIATPRNLSLTIPKPSSKRFEKSGVRARCTTAMNLLAMAYDAAREGVRAIDLGHPIQGLQGLVGRAKHRGGEPVT